MNLEVLANIATILSLPISLIALFLGVKAEIKVNNYENNIIKSSKIKDSKINQNITRS